MPASKTSKTPSTTPTSKIILSSPPNAKENTENCQNVLATENEHVATGIGGSEQKDTVIDDHEATLTDSARILVDGRRRSFRLCTASVKSDLIGPVKQKPDNNYETVPITPASEIKKKTRKLSTRNNKVTKDQAELNTQEPKTPTSSPAKGILKHGCSRARRSNRRVIIILPSGKEDRVVTSEKEIGISSSSSSDEDSDDAYAPNSQSKKRSNAKAERSAVTDGGEKKKEAVEKKKNKEKPEKKSTPRKNKVPKTPEPKKRDTPVKEKKTRTPRPIKTRTPRPTKKNGDHSVLVIPTSNDDKDENVVMLLEEVKQKKIIDDKKNIVLITPNGRRRKPRAVGKARNVVDIKTVYDRDFTNERNMTSVSAAVTYQTRAYDSDNSEDELTTRDVSIINLASGQVIRGEYEVVDGPAYDTRVEGSFAYRLISHGNLRPYVIRIELEHFPGRRSIINEINLLYKATCQQRVYLFGGTAKVTKVVDSGSKNSFRYYMQEYIVGASLDALRNGFLAKDTHACLGTIKTIMMQVMEIGACIYRCGMVLRDVTLADFRFNPNSGRLFLDRKTGVSYQALPTVGSKPWLGEEYLAPMSFHEAGGVDNHTHTTIDMFESLFYIVMKFAYGMLPWEGVANMIKIKKDEMDVNGDPNVFINKIHPSLKHIFLHLRIMEIEENSDRFQKKYSRHKDSEKICFSSFFHLIASMPTEYGIMDFYDIKKDEDSVKKAMLSHILYNQDFVEQLNKTNDLMREEIIQMEVLRRTREVVHMKRVLAAKEAAMPIVEEMDAIVLSD